jgi:hypothetical protein
VSGELDAVDEHRHEVDVVELACDELRELVGGCVDEHPRRVALARAVRLDRRVHRLQALGVAAGGDTQGDLRGDTVGHRVAVAQRLDAGQRDLRTATLGPCSNARVRERHVPAPEADRRGRRAPVMMRAPLDVPALRPGDHRSLLREQLRQGDHAHLLHEGQQALLGRVHRQQQRQHQLLHRHAHRDRRPLLLPSSDCGSLLHGGSFAHGAQVLADLILRPAEEPPLLHDFNRGRGIPVTEDGRISRVRLPRYPRGPGREDYIYNASSLSEGAGNGRSRKVGRSRVAERRTSRFPRIRVDSTGTSLRAFRVDRGPYEGTRMFVAPDTLAMRRLVDDLLQGLAADEPDAERPWEDRYRYLRLHSKRAECSVTGLVIGARWADASGVEAARRLLLERFDLRVGLWDLALNPALRGTVLEPAPFPPVTDEEAEAPTLARRRAEQEAGGVQRALYPGLATAGWKLTRFGLQHSIARSKSHPQSDQPKHPYLRVLVDAHAVRVLVWHWSYNLFDINSFVDARRVEFDAIAVVPPRKPYSASNASILAKYRKPGEVVYEAGRPINDTRWVLLWSVNRGWADVDADWMVIAKEIALRTGAWVELLADAVAECLGVERRRLLAVLST